MTRVARALVELKDTLFRLMAKMAEMGDGMGDGNRREVSLSLKLRVITSQTGHVR
jgi:hypothetical protein